MKSFLRNLLGFLPKPNSGLSNASTRDIWVASELAKLPSGLRILDAGAGECQYKECCVNLNYVSQDFSKYDGTGNREGLQTGSWDTSRIDIVSDITQIPEPSEAFDAILCTEVLEHLPEPVMALKEFTRLLKPGGILILTAPFTSMTHFAPFHYATGFNRYFYEYHLQKLGFESIEIVENGNFFEFLAQELRRLKQMAVDFSNHKPSIFLDVLVYLLLFYLDRFSKRDHGSRALMSYDLQVVAHKGLLG
ncbi:MAG: methyltransferase domain-containing protein [Pseudomonadota bacterium]